MHLLQKVLQGQKTPLIITKWWCSAQIHGEGVTNNVPHMDKSWSKKFTQLVENFGKNLLRRSKCTHVDEVANPSKKATFSSKQGETTSMPPPKVRPFKHTNVLELNNDDNFSSRPIQSMGKSALPHSTKGMFGLPCFFMLCGCLGVKAFRFWF